MAYELIHKGGPRVTLPSLSLSANGRIAVNAAAVRLLLGTNTTRVLLLWDRKARKIAIKPTPERTNSYVVSFSGTSQGFIRAVAFLSHIGWKAKHTQRLSATWNSDEHMLEANLKTGAHV